jgi:hypothetical protein
MNCCSLTGRGTLSLSPFSPYPTLSSLSILRSSSSSLPLCAPSYSLFFLLLPRRLQARTGNWSVGSSGGGLPYLTVIGPRRVDPGHKSLSPLCILVPRVIRFRAALRDTNIANGGRAHRCDEFLLSLKHDTRSIWGPISQKEAKGGCLTPGKCGREEPCFRDPES